MKSFAIFISGRGTNMEALLKAHRDGALHARPAVVISNKSDARGVAVAGSYGAPVETVPWKNADAAEGRCIEILKDRGVDFIVLAGFMKILTPRLIGAFRHRILNIHPALLPAFPGTHAQKQALDYGVRYTGCTTHFVTEGVDAGPVILQRVVPVYDGDTEELLSARILRFEHEILIESVNLMAADCLEVLDGRNVRIHHEVRA